MTTFYQVCQVCPCKNKEEYMKNLYRLTYIKCLCDVNICISFNSACNCETGENVQIHQGSLVILIESQICNKLYRYKLNWNDIYIYLSVQRGKTTERQEERYAVGNKTHQNETILSFQSNGFLFPKGLPELKQRDLGEIAIFNSI